MAEAWAGRVTQWSATTGALSAVVGTFQYPTDIHLCGSGMDAGVVAAEYTAARFGQLRLYSHIFIYSEHHSSAMLFMYDAPCSPPPLLSVVFEPGGSSATYLSDPAVATSRSLSPLRWHPELASFTSCARQEPWPLAMSVLLCRCASMA